LKPKPVLALTGATGFLGDFLVKVAREDARFQVRALARNLHTRNDLVAGSEDLEWIDGAISVGSRYTEEDAAASLDRLMQGADFLVHAAGETKDESAFYETNVMGTKRVIEAARKAQVKHLILVSSLTASKKGISQYGDSKLAAEEIVRASGLEFTIVRPPTIHGQSEKEKDVQAIVNFALKWNRMFLPDVGNTTLVSADYLAKAVVGIVDCAYAVGQIFDIDDGKLDGYSPEEMTALVERGADRTKPYPIGRIGRKRLRLLAARPFCEIQPWLCDTPGYKAITVDRLKYLFETWQPQNPLPTHLRPAASPGQQLEDTVRFFKMARDQRKSR
jgi:nucleoside-diphosphate-sugar epimerase